MDDRNLQQELEALAGNAYNPDGPSTSSQSEPISATIARWNHLFNIPGDDAVERIMEHRNNLTRTRISEEHWDAVRADKEGQGYDREAYEYELEMQKRRANLVNLLPVDEGEAEERMTFLVELSGPLGSVDAVRRAAGMREEPEMVGGWSVEEERSVEMCIVDSEGKKSILCWATGEGGGFEPTILVNPKSMH